MPDQLISRSSLDAATQSILLSEIGSLRKLVTELHKSVDDLSKYCIENISTLRERTIPLYDTNQRVAKLEGLVEPIKDNRDRIIALEGKVNPLVGNHQRGKCAEHADRLTALEAWMQNLKGQVTARTTLIATAISVLGIGAGVWIHGH